MSEDSNVRSEREEIEMLLPWYVMGRLDRDDVERVEAYLARDESLQRQFRLIREEHDQSTQGNEAIAERPARNVERLLAAVAWHRAPSPSTGPDLWDRIRDFFSMPSAGVVRWAFAAAALVIVVQAGILGTVIARQHGETYAPASGGITAAGPGTVALVGFAAGATTSAVAEMLAAHGMAIVDGPNAGGMFTVRLGPRTMSAADRQARIEALKSRSDVVSAVILLR
jgi:anti-sigma-K factor RskA